MRAARRDRGSVSVELATALPAVVLVLAMVLAVVGWARAGVAAADAAALASRIAAVEGAQASRHELSRVMPQAQVEVWDANDGLIVTVRVSVRTAPWLPVATATSSALVAR